MLPRQPGKQLVKTGANFVSDVIDGETLKKAALTNLSSGGQELISSLSSKLSSRVKGSRGRLQISLLKGRDDAKLKTFSNSLSYH